jgi:predicted flap endonuclease-1-like 5' DNA nuclease
MNEPLTSILTFAVIAFVLGFVVAWMVRALRISALERSLGEARDVNQEREKKLSAAQREISDSRGRLLALQSNVDARDRVLAEVKRQLSESGAAEQRCREELASLRAQIDQPPSATLDDTASDATVATFLPATSRRAPDAELPPRQYDTRPAVVDDLKEINGIGPALEKALNRLGIYRYQQIAGWSDADIEYFDAQLEKFRGRIRRESWTAGARELHRRKYGPAS